MKKAVAIFLTVLFMLSSFGGGALGADLTGGEGESRYVTALKAGEVKDGRFTVEVTVPDAGGLKSYGAALRYDASALSVASEDVRDGAYRAEYESLGETVSSAFDLSHRGMIVPDIDLPNGIYGADDWKNVCAEAGMVSAVDPDNLVLYTVTFTVRDAGRMATVVYTTDGGKTIVSLRAADYSGIETNPDIALEATEIKNDEFTVSVILHNAAGLEYYENPMLYDGAVLEPIAAGCGDFAQEYSDNGRQIISAFNTDIPNAVYPGVSIGQSICSNEEWAQVCAANGKTSSVDANALTLYSVTFAVKDATAVSTVVRTADGGSLAVTVCSVGGHPWGEWSFDVEPTCLQRGSEKRVCTGCGETETRDADALGHDLGNWKITTAPGCESAGEETRFCSRCDYSERRTVGAAGHTATPDAAIAPTCTEAGLTEGSHCSVCGKVLVAQATEAALGHDYKPEIIAPTCTENGYTTYTCVRCGDAYTVDGKPASGHSFGAWRITTEPGCEAGGSETRVCMVCGAENTRYVAATGHIPGEACRENETNETYETVVYCSVCNKEISRRKVVKANTGDGFVKDRDQNSVMESDDIIIASAGGTPASVSPYLYEGVAVLNADGTDAGPDAPLATGMAMRNSAGEEKTVVVPGDADGDGDADVSDARLALRRAILLETYAEGSPRFIACDVDNQDGVTVTDARLILRVAIELDDPAAWMNK